MSTFILCIICHTSAFCRVQKSEYGWSVPHKSRDLFAGKYDVLQLAIGVSVGAGLGVVALMIIACVCWIRYSLSLSKILDQICAANICPHLIVLFVQEEQVRCNFSTIFII